MYQAQCPPPGNRRQGKESVKYTKNYRNGKCVNANRGNPRDAPASKCELINLSERIKQIEKALSNIAPPDIYNGPPPPPPPASCRKDPNVEKIKKEIKMREQIKKTRIYKMLEDQIRYEAAARAKVPSQLVIEMIKQMKFRK